jgi:hypothetical protein
METEEIGRRNQIMEKMGSKKKDGDSVNFLAQHPELLIINDFLQT